MRFLVALERNLDMTEEGYLVVDAGDYNTAYRTVVAMTDAEVSRLVTDVAQVPYTPGPWHMTCIGTRAEYEQAKRRKG